MDRMEDSSTPKIPGKGRISRRLFLVIFLGAVVGSISWFYRRKVTAKSIQEFFALEDKTRPLIEEEMDLLKREHWTWWLATVGFFTLVDWGMRFVIPRRIEFRVINYWSWRIFSHRSIAWEYIGYPERGDDLICDGLIPPSEANEIPSR